MTEHWKTFSDGFLAGYSVSDMGRVKDRHGNILKPSTHAEGYKRLCIKGKTLYVHRLVLQAFFPTENKKLVADHINGNRADNSVDNLRWVTKRQNTERAGREGKLSASGIRTPIELIRDDGFRMAFDSQAEASRILNIPDCSINKALKGHRNTVRGFVARYL